MGVNDFSLEIKPPDPSLVGDNDFNFEINTPDLTFVLPQEVLGSKNLTRLSVCGCTVKLPVDGKISCSRLKFLSLSKVCINIVWDIISSCPLIEKLSLSDCECWVEDKTLGISMMETWMWTTPSVESCEFHRLKYLSLFRVSVNSFFFHDFSRKFPCLEDLSLLRCNVYEGIRLSSHSLKCINLAWMRMLRAEFDVPSIRKFVYPGSSIPSLSFPTSSGEWESDINIICNEHCLRAKWFGDLKKLLTELSLSKISLNLMLFLERYIDCVGLIEGLPKPIVENLILSIYKRSASCSPLLDGLFWCCRPKFITQYLLHRPLPAVEKIDFLELICKRLIPDVNQNCYLPSQNMSDLHNLEEVNAEFFEQTLAEWQPLPLKSLLDAFTDPELAQKVRLRLKWSSPDHASSS